jgi:hypothetical protein
MTDPTPIRMWARAIALVLALAAPAAAAPQTVDAYVFWREGCPHCERELEFLERLATAEPRIRVHRFEVLRSAESRRLLERTGAVMILRPEWLAFG